jgi:hypothetical protein
MRLPAGYTHCARRISCPPCPCCMDTGNCPAGMSLRVMGVRYARHRPTAGSQSAPLKGRTCPLSMPNGEIDQDHRVASCRAPTTAPTIRESWRNFLSVLETSGDRRADALMRNVQ